MYRCRLMNPQYIPSKKLLHQPLGLQNTGHKLSLVFGVENFEWPIDDLCFIHEQRYEIFSDLGTLNLFPFQRHTFAWVDLHQNLLTADFIRKLFEQHFALLELCHAIELNPPE